MVKIDFKNFIRDRIWFGWWWHPTRGAWLHMDAILERDRYRIITIAYACQPGYYDFETEKYD